MNRPRNTPAPAPSAAAALEGFRRAGLAAVFIGAVLTFAGLVDPGQKRAVAFGWIWGFAFVWTVALGSLFFVGLHHVTNAVWSVVVRRIAEAFASPLRLLPVLFLPIAVLVFFHDPVGLYPWAATHAAHGDGHHLAVKAPYLNSTFFLLRAVLVLGCWLLYSGYYIRRSLAQDGGAGAELTLGMRRASPVFMILFTFTMTFASFDWLMSLDPTWFSTMFGVYTFSGMILAALAAVTITTVSLKRAGVAGFEFVTKDHLYNLGALLFAFTCFWAYIAFSQYMLIWYANLPEETIYMLRRTSGPWAPAAITLALLRFVIPFLLLLSRHAKRNDVPLIVASLLVLLGQALDLHWIIMPEFSPGAPRLGWAEVGPFLLLTGAVLLSALGFLNRHPAMAQGDPLLGASREFHL